MSAKRNFAKDLEFWMTNLPPRLQTVPITRLAIPGSHDSASYGINKQSKISPDARNPIQYLKCLQGILRPLMIKWSKTQTMDIQQQLLGGVRYFDLRIAMKPHLQQFYFVHNLYSVNVDSVFEAINEFLQSHPNEIVILDCQHFYNMDLNDHRRFFNLLKLIFGLKLLPYSKSMAKITLDYMTQECCQQIIVVYRAELAIVEEFLWPGVCFPTPWPDTVQIPKLFNFLTEGLKNKDDKVGFVTQCVLTPTVWYAFKHLFGSLKSKCVVPLEEPKYSWLQDQKPGVKGINVVISDFVEDNDFKFCKEVINLNLKLLPRTWILPKRASVRSRK